MVLNINEENDKVVAVLDGRLDTVAATELTAEFRKLSEMASKPVVVDCEKLVYIASSGLRLFLSLRKAAQAAGGSVTIKNISDDIRSVFAMTGFLNLFTIE